VYLGCALPESIIGFNRLSLPWVGAYFGNSQVLGRYPTRKAMPGFFLCIFSSLTCLKKPSRIICCGRYQLGYIRIFWPEEGTSQLVTISKRSKIPRSALLREDLSTYPSVIFDLFPQSTGLGQRFQITEGPVLSRPFSYIEKPNVPCYYNRMFFFSSVNQIFPISTRWSSSSSPSLTNGESSIRTARLTAYHTAYCRSNFSKGLVKKSTKQFDFLPHTAGTTWLARTCP
jgi:hypothetical protein